MSTKRKQFPIYLNWREQIELLSPEEVKVMVLSMMEWYDEGVIPDIDSKYPMLKMFFADKFQHMKKLEEDRVTKLEEYRGSKDAPRISKEAVNVDVGVNVGVPVPVPVSVNVPDSRLGERLSENKELPLPTPYPGSPEFENATEDERAKYMDLILSE